MILLTLATAQALAAPFVVEVGEPHTVGVGGNWGRVHLVDGSPWMSFGWNRDLYVAPMSESGGTWTVDEAAKQQLTSHGALSDHGLARCPDGSFLHVASASLDAPNDSAYAWRYDSDWSLLASGTVEERESDRAHNDMAVSCSDRLVGVGFHDFAAMKPAIVTLGADARAGAVQTVAGGPVLTGGSILRDPHGDGLLLAGNGLDGFSVHFARVDTALQVTDSEVVRVLPEEWDAFWPQGLVAAGDHYLLVTLGRPAGTSTNSDVGDVWLVVLDQALEVVDRAQITTTNGASNGCLRPGIARDGQTLLVTCDSNNELWLTEVTVDLAALGVDPDEDTGWDGEDPWADGGASGEDGGGDTGSDEDDDGGKGGCGCAAGGPVGSIGVVLLLGLLGLARRRTEQR